MLRVKKKRRGTLRKISGRHEELHAVEPSKKKLKGAEQEGQKQQSIETQSIFPPPLIEKGNGLAGLLKEVLKKDITISEAKGEINCIIEAPEYKGKGDAAFLTLFRESCCIEKLENGDSDDESSLLINCTDWIEEIIKLLTDQGKEDLRSLAEEKKWINVTKALDELVPDHPD